MGRELSDLIDKGKEEMRDIKLHSRLGGGMPRLSTHADTLDYVNDFPSSSFTVGEDLASNWSTDVGRCIS